MATSDTYTLVISETGVPSPHAASHTAGGGDEISVALSQIDDIAANTVLGNVTGGSAAPAAIATTGTGNVVRATGPTMTLANATGLPLTTGVTGVLPVLNGGTNVTKIVRAQCYQENFASPLVQNVGSTYTVVATTSLTLDTVVPAQNMSLGTPNTLSLLNTSGETRTFLVHAYLNADTGTDDDVLGLQLQTRVFTPGGIYTPILASEVRWRTAHTGSTAVAVDLIVSWFVTLATNQEVAVFISDKTATRNVNIHNMKLAAYAII